jgi:prevent-host-death family protein
MGPTAIGAYEAKTHFGQLLERVREGEQFSITKNGEEVARLVPSDQMAAARRERAAQVLRSSRPRLGANWEEVRQWRDEGRR